MKKLITVLTAIICLMSLAACDNYETYGDKKEKERDAINRFIKDSTITVISESEFHKNGNVTNTDKNEFVYMNNSGVYMQIVHKGCGTPLRDGERNTLLLRFKETCLLENSAAGQQTFSNQTAYDPDQMSVQRKGNTFTASFVKGALYNLYNSAVPAGLLVPLTYINVGRLRNENDHIAQVRLIVPHTQGHSIASSNVYPYYYEITFQRIIDIDL